jgi:hypothetical protein
MPVLMNACDIKGLGKGCIMAGTSEGIYLWDNKNDPVLIWSCGASSIDIKKILPVPYGFFVLTSAGIYFSGDGRNFEIRSTGIPYKVIKIYRDGVKSFTNVTDDLKDIESDPSNPDNLAACSKDRVFISTNRAQSWFSIPGPVPFSSIKSLAIISDPDIKIFLGHSLKGIFSITLGRDVAWKNISLGLYSFSKTYEEIAGIVAEKNTNGLSLYAVNNFTPIIYLWNSISNSWQLIEHFQKEFDMIESLVKYGKYLYFVNELGIMRYDLETRALDWDRINDIRTALEIRLSQSVTAICGLDENGNLYHFSELWLTSKPLENDYYTRASQKRGLYVQATALKDRKKLEKLVEFMKSNSLNMITVDMKDDSGYLRFKPETPLVREIARVVNPLDLDSFIPFMKAQNIYLIARLVTFKDMILYIYNNSIYSVKGRKSGGKPWQGTKIGRNGNIKKIMEYWVDPYSEKVWEYNVDIARELVQRGFDEIQFDYVRFPTDGLNLDDAYYSFWEKGMDKESAIISYLSYARENLTVPISIDIYGANGYYRTDARTGQDVEILRKYVNVICPMFYPSHFSEDFQYSDPVEDRPYRIYYFGTLRNYFIGKKELVIRPYVQVFKLFGQFDRKYFGPKYIANEIIGIRDAIDPGYTFWNMGMKYSILSEVYRNIAIK